MKLEDHIKDMKEDMKNLILELSKCGSAISHGFVSRQGSAETKNVYGETQVKMDTWSDEYIINRVRATGTARYLSSEEQANILEFENSHTDLGIVMDPLDGSSLIGVNLSVGTIIGIYKGNVMQPGKNMVGALYIIYGPLTTLTYTVGKGVHEFVLDENDDFILQKENIKIPEGKIYAPGALRKDYLDIHKRYVEELEENGYKLRYSGSYVADVHQILHKGGVFMYPAYKGKENGKLRLLFEANPMGFIVSQAGGRISDGYQDILSIKPDEIAQRIPIYIGGKREIELIEKMNSE